MRTLKRAAAIAGLALMTGGLFGVTATAASAAPTQESTAAQSAENDRRGGWDNDRRGGGWDNDRGRGWDRGWGRRDRNYVVDSFDTRRECRWRGWIGENRGRWENPRCYRVGGDWLLVVERNRRWH